MNDSSLPLTDDDKLILSCIREHCFAGNFEIKMGEWLTLLSSRSPKYVSDMLQRHQNEMHTIEILAPDHFRLTLHGVYRLCGVYAMLAALVTKVPFRRVKP